MTYSPTSGGGGTRAATLEISSSASTTPLQVQVTGAASSTVYFSATSLSFDKTTTSAPLTIINFEGGPVTMKPSTSITGTDSGLFSASTDCDKNPLDNGASCTLNVTFNPTKDTPAGQHTATLTVTGTLSGSTVVTQAISLTGTN